MRQQVKEMKQVFEKYDETGAGLLDGAGLYKALRALGLEVPVAESDIKNLLAVVGRENEGYVDFDDFKKIARELSANHGDQRFELAFRSLAGPEGITLESLQRACQTQGESWSLEELQEMLNEADKNRDGVIDREEFQNVWKRAGF